MSEIWCCYKVNNMVDRFLSCQYGNNCKQTKKWTQKSPQCSIFSIKNKWIPESDWISVNTFKIQSFHICEILIKLRMISIVILHSYKESNKKTARSQQMIIIVKTKIVYFRELFSVEISIFKIIPLHINLWRNFGSILFVLQNFWHLWMVEEF